MSGQRGDEKVVGKWWHVLSDGSIQCGLCPRFCHLQEGDRGFCFVRKNDGGKLVLTTYGLSTSICIDPIEKKPLNHFLPGTRVLSVGTAGCNLGYQFCQNWSISKSKDIEDLSQAVSPKQLAELWLKHSSKVWFEITNLIIDGVNDSKEEIQAMSEWILENLGDQVPLHFTTFHPAYCLNNCSPTSEFILTKAANQARTVGLKYVYIGNVIDPFASSTYCGNCSRCIILRNGYIIEEYKLNRNNCVFCNTSIPGVFDQPMNNLVAKRMGINCVQPVALR